MKRMYGVAWCFSHPDIDPSVWGFEGREAYDRRVYFWNLMSGVLWQVYILSLSIGPETF